MNGDGSVDFGVDGYGGVRRDRFFDCYIAMDWRFDLN